MTTSDTGLPAARFLQTLGVVACEGKHPFYSWNSLFSQVIDVAWAVSLEQDPLRAERLASVRVPVWQNARYYGG